MADVTLVIPRKGKDSVVIKIAVFAPSKMASLIPNRAVSGFRKRTTAMQRIRETAIVTKKAFRYRI